VQGACNACEKIETDRVQDWTRFPNTDEPTPIGSVTVPTPAVTDYRPNYKDFATPIVNVQNAPAAPAPGAGLAGLADLLGKAGVFKDITGLDATQQNALKTYLSNNENAKAFGEMAKELAMQQHNTQNSGKITEQIDAAKQAGKINQQEAGQLTKEHIQQQIDGGATKKADLEKAMQQALPSVAQAGVDALNRGKGDISTTITRPDGFVESVDAKYSALADQVTQSSGPIDSETATNSALAAEEDWAQKFRAPRSYLEGPEDNQALHLWNYPIGGADLARGHQVAIDDYIKNVLPGLGLSDPAHPTKIQIGIDGYVSTISESAVKESLSQERAQNVKAYLLTKHIPQEQLHTYAELPDASDEWGLPGDEPGQAAARNRSVVLLKYTIPEGDDAPPVHITPPGGDKPSPAGTIAVAKKFTVETKPTTTPWYVASAEVEITVKLSTTDPLGDESAAGITLGLKGEFELEEEGEIAQHIKGKFGVGIDFAKNKVEVNLGAELSDVPFKPEIGLQLKPEFFYLKLSFYDGKFTEFEAGGMRFNGTFSIEGKLNFVPTPNGLLVGSPVIVSAVILGLTVNGIQAAEAEQTRTIRLWAARNGVASRIALELAGVREGDEAFKRHQSNWRTADAALLEQFNAGVAAVENLLDPQAQRNQMDALWQKKYAADGARDFDTVFGRVLPDVGGQDSEGTLEDAIARIQTR